MNNIPIVNVKRQNSLLKNKIDKALTDTIKNSNFILGPEIKKFEKNFARFCDTKYCIPVSSGTTALELSLRELGIKQGDEVITVPHTFIATVEAIINVRAKPIFCEIDKQTFTIDVNKLKNLITKKTKAIIPVDIYGHPCDLDPIMGLAEKYDLAVIEDACQAHGAEYKGKKIGGIAHATAFSFYPSKNLGAFGDAGAITTDDAELAKRVRAICDHGRLQNKKYEHDYIGGNYRMDEIQAAILNVKLKYLKEGINSRRRVALKYRESVHVENVKHPEEATYARHAYHLYVIKTNGRELLRKYLKSKGVSTGVQYPIPLHLQPALKFLGYKKGSFKVTEKCANTVLSLPIYPELRKEEIEFISTTINKFFGNK